MKILIGTNNIDKFNIISKLLYNILGKEIIIDNLSIYKEFNNIDEIGSNKERAKGKAINSMSQIKGYDYYLGIDDGIIIKEKEYVEVKPIINDILMGKIVDIDEKIYITRAFYLIDKDGKEKYFLNKIPYIIRKKINNRDNSGFPLNSVISTINDNKVLTEIDKKTLNKYVFDYTKEGLIKLFN